LEGIIYSQIPILVRLPLVLLEQCQWVDATPDLFLLIQQKWKTGYPPTTDCLPAYFTACYQVCTLLGPTALPQNDDTLYPDTSPATDNSLATNHRPFPGMENRFSTNYGLPSCLPLPATKTAFLCC